MKIFSSLRAAVLAAVIVPIVVVTLGYKAVNKPEPRAESVPAAEINSASAEKCARAICGCWQIPDSDHDGVPEAVVYFYQRGGIYYCKMIATYDSAGKKIADSIKNPVERAKGIAGKPYLCGLDFIYDLKPEGNGKFKGKVADPDSGGIYDCEVWFDAAKDRLVVRGEFLIFGQNQYWKRISEPFKIDAASFKPEIPKGS